MQQSTTMASFHSPKHNNIVFLYNACLCEKTPQPSGFGIGETKKKKEKKRGEDGLAVSLMIWLSQRQTDISIWITHAAM